MSETSKAAKKAAGKKAGKGGKKKKDAKKATVKKAAPRGNARLGKLNKQIAAMAEKLRALRTEKAELLAAQKAGKDPQA